MVAGESVSYGLFCLQDRGSLFIGANVALYEGMIIGENAKESDLVVNACKGKKLTNVRASGSDDAVRLTTPINLSLEQALEYIDEDELAEITPKSIRLRKKVLNANERKKDAKRRAG